MTFELGEQYKQQLTELVVQHIKKIENLISLAEHALGFEKSTVNFDNDLVAVTVKQADKSIENQLDSSLTSIELRRIDATAIFIKNQATFAKNQAIFAKNKTRFAKHSL
jgi:hypothetical protein